MQNMKMTLTKFNTNMIIIIIIIIIMNPLKKNRGRVDAFVQILKKRTSILSISISMLNKSQTNYQKARLSPFGF